MFALIGALALAAVSGDVQLHKKGPEPIGSLEGVFTSDDYPVEALKKNEQGGVDIVIRIDTGGAVADCIVKKSSGSEILDRRTCDVIRERAKFKPARDRKGRPIASDYHQTINWRIAKDLAPSDPWISRIVVNFGPFGEAVSCHIESQGAIQPKPGTPPHPCSQGEMKLNVAGVTKFGGAIDRAIVERSFSPGPEPTPQLAPDEVIANRLVFQLSIDAAGKLVSCKVAQATQAQKEDPCLTVPKEYSVRYGSDRKPVPFSAIATVTTIIHIDRTRPPEATPLGGSLQGLISGDDYPEEALDRGDQGKVGILVHVDAGGAVRDCIVEESSGSAILDKKTCALMRQRAKFKPAVDAQGRATTGEFRTRIVWAIAEDSRMPSDPWTSRTIITFTPDGRPLSCRRELEGALKPAPGTAAPACSPDELTGIPRKIGDLPGAIGTLVIEESFTNRRVRAPLAVGDLLVSRQVVSLDINADGHLTSCKIIERSGAAPDSDACATIDKEYLPRPGPDGWPIAFTAIETISVYVRVEKVALAVRAHGDARP